MLLELFGQALTLQLPILGAGLLFILAIKLHWLEWLNKPIDGGVKLAGRRLFGANKNWRGPVFYIVLGSVLTWVIHITIGFQPWVSSIFRLDPWLVGLSTTTAYVVGELTNSFFKRRRGIGEGASGGRIQEFFDNTDGTLASGLVLWLGFGVAPAVLAIGFLLSVTLHAGTDAVMRRIGLKHSR